jgi:hypothetical protein
MIALNRLNDVTDQGAKRMRPNLSVEKIAGALAVLGTSALIAACGGDKPPMSPVDAQEVAPAGEKAAHGDAHCGADHKDHKAGEASCAAGAKDTAATPAATPAAAAPAEVKGVTETSAKPADGKAVAPAAAPASSSTKPATPAPPAKPGAAPAPAKKAGGASCGAGTCSSKK